MDRRSIVLLLALAVLLQPAFASVCMMQCPPLVAAQPTQTVTGHASHTHHHVMSTSCSRSLAMSSSGICDRTVDVRSSAMVVPTVSPAIATSDLVILQVPIQAAASHLRALDRADRFNAPIVVPLRI
jgi:hypothetical protein